MTLDPMGRRLVRAHDQRRVGVTRAVSTGFDDPDFMALCGLVHGFRSDPWPVRLRAALPALLRAPRLMRSLWRLPRHVVHVTDSPAGEVIRAFLCKRLLDTWLVVATSTLVIPSTFEDYRRGRHRQAMRTNCTHAVRAGVTVDRLEDPRSDAARLHDFFERRGEPEGAAPYVRNAADGTGEVWLASASDGRVLALAHLVTDHHAALLQLMISAPGAHRSESRYLLMAELVRSLSRRGVRHLVVGRTLSLQPGLLYFQRLLGFIPANLTLQVRPAARR